MKTVLVIGGEPLSLVNFRGDLLETIARSGLEVHAAAGSGDAEVERWLSARRISFHRYRLSRASQNPLHDVLTAVSLARLVFRLRPDVVLAYTVKPVVWGMVAARLAGVDKRYALISGLGNAFSLDGRGGLVQRLVPFLYRMALRGVAGVIFQNPDDHAVFKRLGLLDRARNSGVVAGSGIDLDKFAVTPLPEGPPTVLMMARLLREKGVLEYARAARLVRERLPDARFLLAGPYDANPHSLRPSDLQPYIDAGDIEYVGMVDDVRPLLASCHVYVLPSFYGEGVPRTVLEALAVGRAVITTDMPGCRETVRAGNGVLIAPRSAQALADAALMLLGSRERLEACGVASRELAEQVFDVRVVTRSIMEMIGAGRASDRPFERIQ